MLNLNLLDQFNGMECLIFSYPIDKTNYKYVSKSFFYELDKNFLHLKDLTSEITGSSINLYEITDVESLGEDVYHDLVRIRTNNNMTYAIKTIEKKPIPITCHRCGNEIQIPEAVAWHVHGYDGYKNPYDGDSDIVNGLRFCSDCIFDFVGEIPCGKVD